MPASSPATFLYRDNISMTTRLVSPTLKTFLGLMIGLVANTATFAENSKIDATTLTVIGYHEITEHKDALIPSYAVTAQQFSEHIDWLQNNGYHFINVDQLIKAHQGKYTLPTKPVLLTVDDGYQSFYQNAYPIVRAKKIPVVLAVVGSWLEPKANQKVDFGGEEITRNKILSWNELKEMQNSGLVEIASHSYHLHRGVNANPQGNSEPAAITRIYDSNTKTYESDANYQARVYQDLKKNNELFGIYRYHINSGFKKITNYNKLDLTYYKKNIDMRFAFVNGKLCASRLLGAFKEE